MPKTKSLKQSKKPKPSPKEHNLTYTVHSTGYCDTPYCNINHTTQKLKCSCGWECGVGDQDKAYKGTYVRALWHIIEANGLGSFKGTYD